MTIQTIRRTAKTLPVASIAIVRKDWRRDFALMDAAFEALNMVAPSITKGEHKHWMKRWNAPKGDAKMRANAEDCMWRLLNQCAPEGHVFACGKGGWELIAE